MEQYGLIMLLVVILEVQIADPHAYLSNHNYSYDELYDLINEKYLIKMGKVAPWGTTSTNNSTPTTKPSVNNKN